MTVGLYPFTCANTVRLPLRSGLSVTDCHNSIETQRGGLQRLVLAVRVDAHRECGISVTQPRGDDRDRHTAQVHQRRAGMPRVIAGRQSGKTLTAAELRIIYGLFVRGEKIVYSAQRWKTAESISDASIG